MNTATKIQDNYHHDLWHDLWLTMAWENGTKQRDRKSPSENRLRNVNKNLTRVRNFTPTLKDDNKTNQLRSKQHMVHSNLEPANTKTKVIK